MRTIIICIIASLSLVSCVSNKKYTSVENQFTKSQKAIQEIEQQKQLLLNEKESEIWGMKQEVAMLKEEIKSLSSNNMASASNKVSFNEIAFESLEKINISDETDNICSPSELKQLKDLSSFKKFYYEINKNQNINSSILSVFGLKRNQDQKMIVVDYVEYKDLYCNQTTSRFGVGARLSISIKSEQNGLTLSTPTKIAAAVEMGYAEASYELEVLGFRVPSVKKDLAEIGSSSFDVETYLKLTEIISKIINSMSEDMEINPVLLPN
ncbi:MAG TPA: hypothetical protein VKY44_01135 [Flavobacterium sp.]|nr:hypothetical protein [Flavobacterium sp.]